MKVREGFVSNSSSSSFIIGLRAKPITEQELFMTMYPKNRRHKKIKLYNHYSLTLDEIVNIVFNDLQQTEEIGLDKIVEELGHGSGFCDCDGNLYDVCFEKVHKFEDDYCKKYGKEIWNVKNKLDENIIMRNKLYVAANNQYNTFEKYFVFKFWLKKKNEFNNLKLFKLEYSDSDKNGTVMEHGDIFRNIPYIKISKH